METRANNVLENTRSADWERELVTHYTGIGTGVRENYRNNALEKTKVVVNMPQGLGRYGVSDVILSDSEESSNTQPNEFYLKNHLGSTMLVYGSGSDAGANGVKAAYDYRAFGEQIDLIADAGDKVTENFTGKERDDETELNYFGARYLDPMLGLWISVDPKRQFASPYLYAGNGVNPVNGVDEDGNEYVGALLDIYNEARSNNFYNSPTMKYELTRFHNSKKIYDGDVGNFAFRGEKVGGRIRINNSLLSPKEQAATLVHESLEGSIDLRNGTVVKFYAQNWHKTIDGENETLQLIFDNYVGETPSESYNLFLEANYNENLEDLVGNRYPSDDVYKIEYKCLNEL